MLFDNGICVGSGGTHCMNTYVYKEKHNEIKMHLTRRGAAYFINQVTIPATLLSTRFVSIGRNVISLITTFTQAVDQPVM